MVTIDQVIAEKLNQWMYNEWPIGNFVACFIAITLSVILCGVIGVEREMRGRNAGLRTHLLVGVGSCVIMIISIYGFPTTIWNRDIARLAAQVITGVGFLGAGAIIHRNSGTKGLTTAATIWIVMAIGLACGSMNYVLAIGSTILMMVVLTVFRKFENKINKSTPLIILNVEQNMPVISKVLDAAKECGCSIHGLHSELCDDGKIELSFFAIADTHEIGTNEFMKKLESIPGVNTVEILDTRKA